MAVLTRSGAEEILVRAEAPGVDKKDLEIPVKEEKGNYPKPDKPEPKKLKSA